ncbi:MAG: cysteine synthase A [Candidatus Heimdallarchaeota archaeon]|nr:cysteine synthase A [Candidatus Heimdallarchaeota archaeon]
MTYYNSILEIIGKTPLVKLNTLSKDLNTEIFAKIEYFNPGSSIKDRAALGMIEEAEKRGLLNHDTKIVEATSGNTGIGLALVCAVKGYDLTIFMPENASIERQKIMKAFGAKIVLTPVEKLMKGAVEKAKEFCSQTKGSFLVNQFENKANPEIHKRTTAQEIWEDMKHEIDVFISCVGTGGTITGTGESLKEHNSNIHIIAVEPIDSPILSGGKPGIHNLEGMGAGFIPKVLNTEIFDEVISISKEEAYEACKLLARKEGIFAGKSSGAALAAAIKYSRRSNKKERIVIILPDTGERYLSTDLWNE